MSDDTPLLPNNLRLVGGVLGAPATASVVASGKSADINLALVPKGAGRVIFAGPITDTIDLTMTQIANMGSAPLVDIVPGQAGKVLRIITASVQIVDGTIPFASSPSEFNLKFTNDLGAGSLLNGNLPLNTATASTSGPNAFATTQLATTFPLILSGADVAGSGISMKGGSDDASGGIATSVLNNGGAGYAVNDTFTVDFGLGGSLATGHVTGVAAGVVTAYAIDTPGAGYFSPTVGNFTTATSGVGAGLTIDITGITPANGTARLWITYETLTLP